MQLLKQKTHRDTVLLQSNENKRQVLGVIKAFEMLWLLTFGDQIYDYLQDDFAYVRKMCSLV